MFGDRRSLMTTLLTLDAPGWYERLTAANVKIGAAYTEDGYIVREALGDSFGLLYGISDRSSVIPLSSGPYLTAERPDVARADGRRFGITSLSLDLHTGPETLVTFVGRKADGSTLVHQVVVDAVADAYQQVVFPATFTELVGLQFSTANFAQLSFDNLVLTEPAVQHGSPYADHLVGGSGADDLFGYVGVDVLEGGLGDDWLDGGPGDDVMIGGVGDDLYFVTSRTDQVIELAGEGADTVRSGLTYTLPENVENLELLWGGDAWGAGNGLNNRLTGNTGANTLRGFGGADTLIGGAGDDTLEAGWGSDVLYGGAGLDLLRGGGEADVFVFRRDELGGEGPLARILDFSRAQGDKLSVGGVFVWRFIGTDPFTGDPGYFDEGASAGQFRYETSGDGLTLMGDVDGDGGADWTIQMDGVTSLQASDFVF
jgi:Ca2+-binding RTX toxin-like protein